VDFSCGVLMSNYLKKHAAQAIAEAISDANISPPEAARLAKAIMEALTEEGYEIVPADGPDA
jgi:hypothetical protein